MTESNGKIMKIDKIKDDLLNVKQELTAQNSADFEKTRNMIVERTNILESKLDTMQGQLSNLLVSVNASRDMMATSFEDMKKESNEVVSKISELEKNE